MFARLQNSRWRFITSATHHLVSELVVFGRDFGPRRRIRRILRGRSNLRLNLGCGPKTKEGWINLDLAPEADFRIDLRQPLPLASNSSEIIFAEHFLEHLDYPLGANRFVRECFRVLAPEGILKFSVPDTEEPLRAYRSDHETRYFDSEKVAAWHADWCRTPIEHLNYHFRQNTLGRPPSDPEYHHFAYDFETLEKLLAGAGFARIKRREFDPNLDSEDRREGSLRVVAHRP